MWASRPLRWPRAPAVSTATAVAAAPASAEIPRRPVTVEVGSRRRFLIRMGVRAATVVVLGAEVANILRVEDSLNITGSAVAPIPFPNANSPVLAGSRHPSRVHAGGRSLSRRHRPLAAADRCRIVAATDQRSVAHPVTLTLEQTEVGLQGAQPVHHAFLHFEPGRGDVDRHHAVDRPLCSETCLPRRRRCRKRAMRTCCLWMG